MAAAEVQPDNDSKTNDSKAETEPAGEQPTQFLLPMPGKELAGVSPKRAAEPPQRQEQSSKTTLRALQQAAESEKALASVKEQAASAIASLRAAEQQLLEEKKLRTAETDRMTLQLANLNQNLSAAVRHTTLLEAAARRERRSMLAVSAVLIATALAITALLVSTRKQQQPGFPAPVVVTKRLREEVPPAPGSSPETRALDRFTRALSLVPNTSMSSVLRSANRLLLDSGAQPCSTESTSGELALLLGPAGNGQPRGSGPLATTLARCAEAVEQTIDREREHPGDTAGAKKE
jgi:hypothetical protein